MASKYYYGAILAATLASASHAVEERELGSWKKQPNWGHGGWGHDGWGHSSSSSSSSSKSGKSAGGGGKSGKSGGSGSSSSSSDDHHGWGHGGGWGKPQHGGWSSSSSSSSGKSGKSSGGKSGKSGGSSSSSNSHDVPNWYPSWGGVGWGESSSSSSSGKSGKSSGGKSGKGSSSSSSSYDGPGWGGKPGKWGNHGGWGGKPGKWGHHGGWPSSSSSSSSSKSGKSGGGKSGKSSGSSSSSSSHDHGGYWTWVGPAHGWSSSSSSSSGKSGKSGGSGSGKSGKSGGTSSSSGSESIDSGKWSDDDWDDDDNGAWVAPPEIYSKGGSVAGWNADGWDNDGHYKADIDYVRAHVIKLIEDSERELIPKFLRLGFHDCVGGCDGCLDLSNADNKGLKEPIDAIYPLVEKFSKSHSRADIWALATLVSADMAVMKDRPIGLTFPMRYIGRKDCSGAGPDGDGGPDVEMPSNHLTTHGLLDFFKKYFDFDEDETVTIMGVHAVAVAHRNNNGFGNVGKEDGWVFDAESYELNNRYYGMLVGDNDWHLELVHNDNGIPSRYQWYTEKDGKEERPIMTNADMALVRDMSDYMYEDADGNEGAVSCEYIDDKSYAEGSKGSSYTRGRALQYKEEGNKSAPACPVASHTMEKMIEYKMDNELFLYDFEKVLEKMVKNGY